MRHAMLLLGLGNYSISFVISFPQVFFCTSKKAKKEEGWTYLNWPLQHNGTSAGNINYQSIFKISGLKYHRCSTKNIFMQRCFQSNTYIIFLVKYSQYLQIIGSIHTSICFIELAIALSWHALLFYPVKYVKGSCKNQR